VGGRRNPIRQQAEPKRPISRVFDRARIEKMERQRSIDEEVKDRTA